MSRRPHAQLHLPPLSAKEALAVVAVLQRVTAAIVRVHGDAMHHHADMLRQEARARRHGVSIANLLADDDVEF